MLLYMCRYRGDAHKYHRGISAARGILQSTTNLAEAYMSADKVEMDELARAYPVLEVCSLTVSAPMPIDGPASVPTLPEVTQEFEDVMKKMERIHPVFFCNMDDNGAVLEYSRIAEEPSEDRIYVELVYPSRKGSTGGLGKLNLK